MSAHGAAKLLSTNPVPLAVRILCFLAAGTSGAALLAKVYGVASMQAAVFAVGIPASVALVLVWLRAHRAPGNQLAASLESGVVGGLLGTLAYDLVRVPFHLSGRRLFAPISAYGVWISDATMSTRFTDLTGWAYHFWNGIAFGVMYTLFMSGRHWGYAILWGLALETIAVASPFARIFSLSGNYSALAVAYAGHVAYGVPLGLFAQDWNGVRSLSGFRAAVWATVLAGAAAAVWVITSPAHVERDARARAGGFRVENGQLNPGWIRLDRGGRAAFVNPSGNAAIVRLPGTREQITLSPLQSVSHEFATAGVHQVFVRTNKRSQSSFVIVEPVEALR